MLRAARLFCAAGAAGALGTAVFILFQSRALSPLLPLFPYSAALFIQAVREMGPAPARARLYAWAAALALAGLSVLAGFGAGVLSLPFGVLGLVAAWLANRHYLRSRPGTPPAPLLAEGRARWFGLTYLLVGLVAAVPQLAGGPGAIGLYLFSALIWPVTVALWFPSLLVIMLSFGTSVAFAAAAVVRETGMRAEPAPRGRRHTLLPAAATGLLLVALVVLLAMSRTTTSARFELGPYPLFVIFVGGFLVEAGFEWTRGALRGGGTALAIGATVVLYALLSRPTVECLTNGVATSTGPWWLPQTGILSSGRGASGSSGGVSTGDGARGIIERNDGITITYRCTGDQLSEFQITRAP